MKNVVIVFLVLTAINLILAIIGVNILGINIGVILLALEISYLLFSFGTVKVDEVATMFFLENQSMTLNRAYILLHSA